MQLTRLDLVADDLQPVVIAASQGDLTTKGCQALADEAAALSVADAGVDAAVDGGIADASADAEVEAGPPPEPPAVRAGGLPALPAGTLASDKSILLVAAGCFGAPGFVDPLDNVVCGQGYAPDQPTLAPVLVQMSRIKKSDRLGLAVVNASVAGSAITVRSVGPEVAALPDVTIAVNVGVGAISPKPPNFGATTAALGFSQGDPSLDVSASNNVTASVSVPWKNAVAPAGTGEPKDGETYAIVMLGPQVNVAVTKWWNPVGISVVTTDPQ